MDDIIFFFSSPANNVNDLFKADRLTLQVWEKMLAEGWRHNAKWVFRNSHDFDEYGNLNYVLPLRYKLKSFNFSKSQRKIFNKNQDLSYVFQPLQIDDEKLTLFDQHIQRFKFNKPDSIFNFVSNEPGRPFKTWELCVYDRDRLIACSFIDITQNALSSTYAMFDLTESKRSLGIYTMILEIKYAIDNKKRFYYPGYAYDRPSFYDYKKKFANTEFYDWQSRLWLPFDSISEKNDTNSVRIII